MLQLYIKPFSTRLILSILLILPLVAAVKPVWRTPITNVGKNATARTQRASNSAPQEGYDSQKVPYYTRPEDFKIPDYRPPRPNLPNGFNPNVNPQFNPIRPPFQQQQFFPNFRPPVQGGGFVPQQPRIPQYSNNLQPVRGLFIPNFGPGPIPPTNNGRQQWFVPPNAAPYWEGAGPIPPQGAFGPTTTTTAAQERTRPSVNPDNYQGTLPTQPSANPETFTTASDVKPASEITEPFKTRGWYNPTSTSAQPTDTKSYTNDGAVEHTSPTQSIFNAETNPYTESSSTVSSAGTALPTTEPIVASTRESTTSIFEDITKYFPEEGTTSSQNPRTTDYIFEEELTTFRQPSSITTLETPEDIYDHTDIVQDIGIYASTTVIPKSGDVQQTKQGYFPRPVSSQAYQPPGHLPEDFTQHIDVNFLKPNRTCVGPLCGVDVDKVSLYNPGKDGDKGPTLLISNAAKGDAARIGYIPPNPRLISDFTPPPSSTEYYNRNLVPGSINYPPGEVSGPFPKGEHTTIEPFRAEIPQGPHIFMPPQHFPAPPLPTLVPAASQTIETTIVPSYSPTAKTIAPPTTTEYITEETTEATTSFSRATTENPYTLPPFETTAKSTESTTEEFTTTQIHAESPPTQALFTTEQSLIPWSPTYKTVPPPSSATLGVETPFPTSTAAPTTAWIPFDTSNTYSSEHPPTQTAPSLTPVPVETTATIVASPRQTTTSAATSEQQNPPSRPSSITESTAVFEKTTDHVTTPEEVQSTSSVPFTPPPVTLSPILTTRGYSTISTTLTPSTALTRSSTSPTPFGSTSSPSSTTSAFLGSTTFKSSVMNRVRGKVHVVCKEEGIEFSATTLFPLTGQIFANERKRVPGCLHNITGLVTPKVFLPFAECGVKNDGDQHDKRAQYHMQVVVVIQQKDGTSTIQSFMAQCVHQKILYNKQTLPRRIEEALEELRLVATKLEQKAPLPQVEMKIVVDEHHQIGPEVSEVDIGMPLAVQWKLLPESDAYGFHVKNCIVRDDISKVEHKMIDELGCSTDLSIFAHPHYDTYHDTASSHLWAFKVPDHTRLRIRCDVAICSDVPSSTTNISSCASIPSPPFCPDLITSPSNSILYDAEGAFLKRRRQVGTEMTQSVRATLCTGGICEPQPLALDRRCFDLHWVAASTGFSFASLIAAIIIHIVVKVKISR